MRLFCYGDEQSGYHACMQGKFGDKPNCQTVFSAYRRIIEMRGARGAKTTIRTMCKEIVVNSADIVLQKATKRGHTQEIVAYQV